LIFFKSLFLKNGAGVGVLGVVGVIEAREGVTSEVEVEVKIALGPGIGRDK